MEKYLADIIRWYLEGKRITLNISIVCEQGSFTRSEFVDFLINNGMRFEYRPHVFRINGETVHAKNGDLISIYNGKSSRKNKK